MSHFATCDMCSGRMVEIDSKTVGGLTYSIFKCENCSHIIARSG